MRTHHPASATYFRCTAAALVAGALGLSACGGAESVDRAGAEQSSEPTKLVLAHHDGGTEHVKAWADAVERLSGGSLEVDIATNWRAGERDYEQATLGDVRKGKAPLAAIAARAFDEAGVTSFQPLHAPMLIDSRELENAVLRGEVGQAALEGTGKLGMVGLALLPTELRRPVGIERPLVDAEDWKGARVYTREGVVARETIEALGATPVHTAVDHWSEDVDGAEVGLGAPRAQPAVARKAAGITANVVLWPQPLSIVVSSRVFDDLSERQQSALRGAADEAFVPETRVVSAISDEDRAVVCRLGAKLVTASPSQLDDLRAAVEPVYRTIEKGSGNREALERIKALKADATPETVGCSAEERRQSSAGAGSPDLAGTFRTTISKRELADSPLLMDAGEINDENWGTLTLRLEDGRVRFTTRNPQDGWETNGTYSTDGDTVDMVMEDIGETFSFKWSLYRGKLELERDEALGVAPTMFLIKPFRRVS